MSAFTHSGCELDIGLHHAGEEEVHHVVRPLTLARATTATIRRRLNTVPAWITSAAGRIILHLPSAWPWKTAWTRLLAHACGPLAPATT